MLVRPLTRPLVRPLTRRVTEPGFGGRRFTYYVDSVSGSDANDGLTADTAFQTIGKLNTTLSSDYSGQRIGLARGGYWREQLGSSANTSANVVIGAYGAGQLPVLDAADVASSAGWAKTATYTNVYDRTWSHAASVNSALSVWEDGVRLRWVASAALCDATPGTYYCAKVAGATTTVYLHASDSSDPTASGKTYEIATRDYGICAGAGGTNWNISDVRTKRNAHDNGSLVVMAPNSVVQRCIAEDGTKHNVYISDDCAAYDCIAWKSDWHDRTNTTAFVAFSANGTGKSAKFVRCLALMEAAKAQVAVSASAGFGGFYAHTAGGKWTSIEYVDCVARGAFSGFSYAKTETAAVLRCHVEEARNGVVAQGPGTITDLRVYEGVTVTPESAVNANAGPVHIDGLRHRWTVGSIPGSVYTGTAGVEINLAKSVICRIGDSGAGKFLTHGFGADSTINSTRNILAGIRTDDTAYRIVGFGSADFNVYWPADAQFRIRGSTYNDFASYKTAEAAFDQNSVADNPLLVDPANGDFNVAEGSPAIALGAGLERPNITYTAIPSDAAIAAM